MKDYAVVNEPDADVDGEVLEAINPVPTEEQQEVVKFLYKKENIGQCHKCPLNCGASDWGGNRPCGQQNCWVSAHVNSN